MPRTKVAKKGIKKESKREDQDDTRIIEKFANLEKESLILIREEKERQLVSISKHYCDMMQSISGTVLSTTIGDCKRLGSLLHDGTISNLTKSRLDVTKSTRKTRSRSCDDGYLTTESSNSSERGRSRAKKQTTAKSTVKTNRFLTPASKGRNPYNYEPVTPKIKPNTPQIIMRRPVQGEMALSLQGSPLLVNPVLQECATTVNIPLEDGCQLSLLPQTGLRPSMLPALDQNTLDEIRIIHEHLSTLLNPRKQ